jgi:hypothetical protein
MKKAQSLIEKAVFILCIALALIAVQAYIKHGLSAKVKQNVDALSNQFDPLNGEYSKNSSQQGDISYATMFTDTKGATGQSPADIKKKWVDDFVASYKALYNADPTCLDADGVTNEWCGHTDAVGYISHDPGGNYTAAPSGEGIYPIACQVVGNSQMADPLCKEVLGSTTGNKPMSSSSVDGSYDVEMKKLDTN